MTNLDTPSDLVSLSSEQKPIATMAVILSLDLLEILILLFSQ